MTPEQLLVAVRRRLRMVRAGATLAEWAWFAAVVAVVVVALARVVSWAPLEPLGLALPLAAVLVMASVAAARPTGELRVAALADRGLGSRDALSAYLEFAGSDRAVGPFAERIERRAREVAAAAEPAVAVPRPRVRPWKAATLAVALPAALALAAWENPLELERARERAAERELAEVVEELREAAEQHGPETATGRELLELAERLEQVPAAEAAGELARAEARLLRRAGDDLHSARAASDGLDAAVAERALPGAGPGDGAAEQLESAAAALGSMSPAERGELAERLSSLAATQAAGAPEVADALRAAAEAVANGEEGAADDLRAAAGAHRRATAAVDERTGAASAAEALAAARERLASSSNQGQGQGEGQGQGQGEGQGQGQGEGEGQGQGEGEGQGQGEGEGQGQGEGEGQGQGRGSGPASGNVGAGQRSGQGEGQGGAGRIGEGQGGSTSSPEAEAGRSQVFAPEPRGRVGDEGPTRVEGGDLGEREGDARAATERGQARLPLSDAVRRYREGATRALDRPGLPSVQRELIGDYFDRLSRAGG